MNRRVIISKHVCLADGKWRYCRPVLDAKGKIIPDMLIVNALEERHAEGTYCICFYNPKLTWQKCGRKRVVFKTFLMAGPRESELVFLIRPPAP